MKKIILIFVFLALITPLPIFAQVPKGMYFGGQVLVSTPCTCIPGSVRVQYSVIYPLKYPFAFRALLLLPTTIRYAYGQFLVFPPPLALHLGRFLPNPALPCLGVPPACLPALVDGGMIYVGSSGPTKPITISN